MLGELCIRITVDVKAGAKEEGIEELGESHFLVKVKAPRRKGKANAQVVKLIQRHFGRRAAIVRGHTSTRKTIELEEK
jgi:uncharacterized protein (TIGR00251 family)